MGGGLPRRQQFDGRGGSEWVGEVDPGEARGLFAAATAGALGVALDLRRRGGSEGGGGMGGRRCVRTELKCPPPPANRYRDIQGPAVRR